MPGPAPKADPARRNSRVGPLRLPAEGRKGKPPTWPLEDGPTSSELAIWRQLWGTPQAVAWERLGWTRTVGRYCRYLTLAEAGTPVAAVLSHVVGLEDRLGLTPKAMRMLLWEIVVDEVADKRARRPVADVRSRIKAVG